MGQEAVPEGIATAAGLMGTGEAIGGFLALATGVLADTLGLQATLSLAALSLLLPLGLALAMPRKRGDTTAVP